MGEFRTIRREDGYTQNAYYPSMKLSRCKKVLINLIYLVTPFLREKL